MEYYLDHKRIEESRKRIIKAYRMEEVDHVPIIQLTRNDLGYSIYDIVYKKEAMLHQQLTDISATMKHKTDHCPMLAPWHGVGMYAELFGCEVRFYEDEWPWTMPLITDDPNDVYKLKPKKLSDSDLWKHLFETISYFQLNTKGDIPICTTDPQGPLATASMIWQTEDLLCACYTNPKEVHFLLSMITDVFIEFYEKQLKIIDYPAYPGWGFPLGEQGMGISLSDDNAAFMSPGLYEEFSVPYNSRISEHFNGLYLHSCGNWMHNIKPALKTSKLRALNYHSAPREGDPKKYRELIGGECAVWTGATGNEVGFGGMRPDDHTMFSEYLIPMNMKHGQTGLIIAGAGDYGGTDDKSPKEMDDFYDWLIEIMHT